MADRRVLTDAFLKALAPTGSRFDIWDEGNAGFGIRVGSKGGISFEYVYRRGHAVQNTCVSHPLRWGMWGCHHGSIVEFLQEKL